MQVEKFTDSKTKKIIFCIYLNSGVERRITQDQIIAINNLETPKELWFWSEEEIALVRNNPYEFK